LSIPYNTPATLEFIGNNTANAFSVTFPTFEADNIEASVADSDGVTTDLVVDTDFTLSDVGLRNTNASLSLVNAGQAWLQGGNLKTGYTLFIKFNPIAYQPSKFRDLGRFSPEVFEKTLDRLTMNVLAVNDKASKAVQLQLGDSGNGIIPPLGGNAGKILQVNAAGDGFEYGIEGQDLLDARDDAETAATAAEASEDAAEASEIAAAASQAAAALSAADALNSKNLAETAKTAAETAQAGAGASESAAQLSATSAATSAANALTKANEAAASALAASTAEGFKLQAEAARNQAQTYRDTALSYSNSASSSATAAASSATDANAAKTASEGFRDEAEGFRDESEVSKNDSEYAAEQAELFSGRQLFDKIVNLDFTMSPYTIDEDADPNTLFIVDDSLGDVDIILPFIFDTTDHTNWKAGIVKAGITGNQINVLTTGGDTINVQPSTSVQDPKTGILLYAETPTDWKGLTFMNATIAAEALPAGGNPGDILMKNSTLNSDASWRPDPSIINALIFG
jgi:hypothetical protein